MKQTLWIEISQHISRVTEIPFLPGSIRSLGGGSINSAYHLANERRSFFVKCNSASQIEMFIAESAGLQELAKAQVIRIPTPLCWGVSQDTAYLVMDYIEFGSNRAKTGTLLGQQLAALHQVEVPQFGWERNNTIGSTPQINTWTPDWISFYRDHRLGFQLKLAARRFQGSWIQRLEKVMENLPTFFEAYDPKPSLLHGDLWSGNYGADGQGDPVIFDPAVYYGDRETDIAMTELFGGFPPQFYDAYDDTYPLDPGYPQRKPLYQLYHYLNHLNLFGASYLSSVEHSLQMCLRCL